MLLKCIASFTAMLFHLTGNYTDYTLYNFIFQTSRPPFKSCLFRHLSQTPNLVSKFTNGVKEIVMCNSKAR